MSPKSLLILLALCALPFAVLAQNSIVWSGGISLDEREQAPADGTKLVFFVKSGSFLSDVKVVIRNAQGEEVVNTTTLGPWLILALTPGRYHVVAQAPGGESQAVNIEVTDGNQEFGFMFTEE